MQRRSAKNRHSDARTPAETKIWELSGRKSPQKRAIRRRAGNVRFMAYETITPCHHYLAREPLVRSLIVLWCYDLIDLVVRTRARTWDPMIARRKRA